MGYGQYMKSLINPAVKYSGSVNYSIYILVCALKKTTSLFRTLI